MKQWNNFGVAHEQIGKYMKKITYVMFSNQRLIQHFSIVNSAPFLHPPFRPSTHLSSSSFFAITTFWLFAGYLLKSFMRACLSSRSESMAALKPAEIESVYHSCVIRPFTSLMVALNTWQSHSSSHIITGSCQYPQCWPIFHYPFRGIDV